MINYPKNSLKYENKICKKALLFLFTVEEFKTKHFSCVPPHNDLQKSHIISDYIIKFSVTFLRYWTSFNPIFIKKNFRILLMLILSPKKWD